MKKYFIYSLVFFSAFISANSDKRLSVYINGPSFSRHFYPFPTDFNEVHFGLGAEVLYNINNWTLGAHGHYMFNDSINSNAYWIAFQPGYYWGNSDKLWLNTSILLGGIKKINYNSGRFSPFLMPVVSLGYKRFGINVSYIPTIPEVTYPLVIIQLKYRLL